MDLNLNLCKDDESVKSKIETYLSTYTGKEHTRIHQKCFQLLLFPYYDVIRDWIIYSLIIILFWISIFCFFGEIASPPNGIAFQVMFLLILGLMAGKVMKKIYFPPLFGMLLVGIVIKMKFSSIFESDEFLWPIWSSNIRGLALIIILMKAGLGLDPDALRRLSRSVLRLAFIPCLMETFAIGIISHFSINFPWFWGFLLGFVLSAVSPAVVVPSLLNLQKKGYGISKGIPTLVIASASLDDVLAITGFTIFLSILFQPETNIGKIFFKVSYEILFGILFGNFWGLICIYVPSIKIINISWLRLIMLCCGGVTALFGSQRLNIAAGGPLSVIIMSLIASVGWKKNGNCDSINFITSYLSKFWIIFEPLLFGLIGLELQVENLENEKLFWSIFIIIFGSIIRLIVSFCVVYGNNFTIKEHLFISIAWLPKATVQAAIGGRALDLVKQSCLGESCEVLFGYSTFVLNSAILIILITAPLGALLISFLGPILLHKNNIVL